MPNYRYARSKTHINIGTIGEFGHGKTTLTAAITKILSTRVERNTEVAFESINEAIQERENGITIRISHIQYETDNRQYAPSIVVFINKCDIVEDPDVLEIVEREIREHSQRVWLPRGGYSNHQGLGS